MVCEMENPNYTRVFLDLSAYIHKTGKQSAFGCNSLNESKENLKMEMDLYNYLLLLYYSFNENVKRLKEE